VAVVGASLLGSTHCVGMCGGIALNCAKSKATLSLYHFGRLTGYLWLGLLGGTLGAATIGSEKLAWLSWISAALVAFAFFQMGYNVWKGKGSHLFALPKSWQRALHEGLGSNPFSIGAFSALLPCGWLHSFVLAAIATQNPIKGALVLFLFWLGTVPALSLSPWAFRKVLQPIARKLPKMTAVLLIVAGVMSLGIRANPLFTRHLGSQETNHPNATTPKLSEAHSERQSCH
jgi:sulfite exporter TauE/SafE